jgi:hypothetical protein
MKEEGRGKCNGYFDFAQYKCNGGQEDRSWKREDRSWKKEEGRRIFGEAERVKRGKKEEGVNYYYNLAG